MGLDTLSVLRRELHRTIQRGESIVTISKLDVEAMIESLEDKKTYEDMRERLERTAKRNVEASTPEPLPRRRIERIGFIACCTAHHHFHLDGKEIADKVNEIIEVLNEGA